MVSFFKLKSGEIYALNSFNEITQNDVKKLTWLFSNAEYLNTDKIQRQYVGPRKTMITPWSTNAVEITQNMGFLNIDRIEKFIPFKDGLFYDKMTSELYQELNQDIYKINIKPEKVREILNIKKYNEIEGLALNKEEIEYLEKLSKKLKRNLTDSEVFGFSQVNSEHCRHKIFNGTFILDDKKMSESLFQLIKKNNKNKSKQCCFCL